MKTLHIRLLASTWRACLWLLAACLLASLAHGQSTKVLPDCAYSVLISGAGASASGPNGSSGCSYWVVTWEQPAGGDTVTIQSAPSAGSSPGTWATFVGDVLSGTNPSTSRFGTVSLSGFVPYIRVSWNGSGLLTGRILGWKELGGSSGGGGSVTVSNFPDPQNVEIVNTCSTDTVSSVAVTFSALAGSQYLVNPVLNQRVILCSLQLSWDNAINLKLIQGSGVACATGSGDITGPFTNTVNVSLGGVLRTASSSGLCVNTSASASGGGVLRYVQQ